MLKIIGRVISFGLGILLVYVIVIGLLGYYKYKEVIGEVTLGEKVEIIKKDKDYVPLEDVSPLFTDAIISIEDHRFYEHGAFDIISLVRAAIINLKENEIKQGGSTITQQVAKNLYFSDNQTFIRKIAELLVAFDLEGTYTKDQILELYVNIIYYGDGNYGIKEASENYFGKDPSKLSFDEATILAGLPQAPSVYSLDTNYKLVKERQQEVIDALKEYNNYRGDE
ncbi:transglycosylase domain-containing protein [Metabacillus endolithicus]|uniref:peptidoglycan glycosyltransferase n=1 Tax=Metabacillus endolithicus TaxID=1535204 RepID=A0ABW5C563_9BACI|nr:biosynthetic peptidoglycan transglycosylase [Metabacillus endolithicus]UPG66022.1 transglycosylase domain-containing protein [Metabacillus endolithicus]